MPRYTVFQMRDDIDETHGLRYEDIKGPIDADFYRGVGHMEADNLGHAFEKMQRTDEHPNFDEGFTPEDGLWPPPRSMSVSDVLAERDRDNHVTRWWYVQGMGFKEVIATMSIDYTKWMFEPKEEIETCLSSR